MACILEGLFGSFLTKLPSRHAKIRVPSSFDKYIMQLLVL
jgi:hypothetical protein